ncbi:MAG TPA: hypothetical protein VMO47_10590, partial [Rhodothermales bacterium]|nr:hypothetical protein [Rhodothermales bacterium]
QQMKNDYADLEKVLSHFGCTFDDVVVENIYTTTWRNSWRSLRIATRSTRVSFLQARGSR